MDTKEKMIYLKQIEELKVANTLLKFQMEQMIYAPEQISEIWRREKFRAVHISKEIGLKQGTISRILNTGRANYHNLKRMSDCTKRKLKEKHEMAV